MGPQHRGHAQAPSQREDLLCALPDPSPERVGGDEQGVPELEAAADGEECRGDHDG